jgi:ABC-type antimicrobial peptide transport system permease subunit
MNEMFGVSMTIVAGVSLALTAVIFLIVGWVAYRNPVMFKMGLRNIPRRPAQTGIIIVGLMLSTVIMTAAFGTGDTMTRSITQETYDLLGEGDEFIQYDTENFPAPREQQVIPAAQVDAWKQQFAGDPDIEGFMPLMAERLPVRNVRSNLSDAQPQIVGFRPEDMAFFGGLKDTRGREIVLGADEVAVNEELADVIEARAGDEVILYFEGQEYRLRVAAIVPNSLLSGTFDTINREGGAVSWQTLARITSRSDSFDAVFVSNTGGVRSGLDRTGAVMDKLEAALAGTPYEVNDAKRESVRIAELFGNIFTSFFLVMGLFSIAAGVLLIFLIFVMLAAERKPEMGMARAVGAKRRQIVESFLAEGLGYDFGAAIVGLAAGIGVVFAMIGVITYFAGDTLGLRLTVHFTPRSLITAFSLGIIVTFIVITLASIRASRLNITAAIRDLPETRPINPEGATFKGYLRGILNAVVAFGGLFLGLLLTLRLGSPVFLLLVAPMIAGPWVSTLRNSNFGRPRADRLDGEGLPRWPLVLGVVTLPLMGLGAIILVGYGLAVLIVRLTRERRPANIPAWLVVLGIIIPPLGLVLAALQDHGRQVAWSAGFGAVALVLGLIMAQWGLERNGLFLFAAGLSLAVLWVAVTLRYFRIAERASFTFTSLFLLLAWYTVPANRFEWLLGELRGDFEMFFLSGLVMVSCATFIVVYNADLVLPVVAAFGSRFGRIVPAVKTAVAYPLTSKFRTGMTVAMIGLIMFALIMFSTINANFVRVFLGNDAKGGYDIQAAVNGNNLIDDLGARLAAANVDLAPVERIAEVRIAYPFEVEVKDPTPERDSDTGQLDEFGAFTVFGADASFLEGTAIPMKLRAAGYDSDRAIWDAVARDPNLAVVPNTLFIGIEDFGGPPGPELVAIGDLPEDGFEPFTLTFRDPSTGDTRDVTVIGVMKEQVELFYLGIFVQKATLLETFPASLGQTYYVKLKPREDTVEFAKTIEATLVQAQSESLDALIDEQQRASSGFLTMFQGFMGLGLLIGIAALGVISFRAVVERRQQIGMLRAIGYQRSMIMLSFLFESSFIAISGILIGFSLAVSLSYVLFTSGGIDEASAGAGFTVPWLQLTVISAIAFFASLAMTVLPARQASRVAIAEALRYE